MTIQKLERVMWRIRKNNPGTTKIKNAELKRAIMYECGTYIETYNRNRRALILLHWIKTEGTNYIRLTDKDLTE